MPIKGIVMRKAIKCTRPVKPHLVQGFSLIELMLVISIAAGIAVAALVFGSKVWESSKVADARELTRHLTASIQSRFAVFPNFQSLDGGSGPASAEWVPGVVLDPNGQVKGPWGSVVMMPYTLYQSADAWSLTFNQVPKGACVELLASLSRNFRGIGANGTMRWPASTGIGIDPSEATEICSNTVNSVVFVSQGRIVSNTAPVAPKF